MLGQSVVDAMSVNGELVKRSIDNNAPHRSQLVDDRRSQVIAYSQAFSCMPTSISSYLLAQNEGYEVDCGAQTDKLKAFVELEKNPIDKVISEAYKNIAVQEAKIKKQRSLFYRLKCKILNFFK